MNKTILSGSVQNVKHVEGLSSKAVQFFLRVNSLSTLSANKEVTTLVPCVIINPRDDIARILEKKPTIECEGKIIRLAVPSENNMKAYRTQVVVNQRSILYAPR